MCEKMMVAFEVGRTWNLYILMMGEEMDRQEKTRQPEIRPVP
jgi:hypothetical protein